MKSLTLAAGLGLVLVPYTAAESASFAIGNPLASECYEAALEHDDSPATLRTCERALEDEALDRDNRVATLVNRGILHMLRGKSSAAVADFDRASSLDSSAADPLLNKGLLRLREGRGDEALALLEQAMERENRREALVYYARGLAHEQTGNVRAAYADLVRARDLEPGWDMPSRELARYTVRRR